MVSFRPTLFFLLLLLLFSLSLSIFSRLKTGRHHPAGRPGRLPAVRGLRRRHLGREPLPAGPACRGRRGQARPPSDRRRGGGGGGVGGPCWGQRRGRARGELGARRRGRGGARDALRLGQQGQERQERPLCEELFFSFFFFFVHPLAQTPSKTFSHFLSLSFFLLLCKTPIKNALSGLARAALVASLHVDRELRDGRGVRAGLSVRRAAVGKGAEEEGRKERKTRGRGEGEGGGQGTRGGSFFFL